MRLGREVKVTDAVTFLAGDRVRADEAFPGDIIGLHSHGTIQIGDTFTEGEALSFTGVPNFAPELFRRVRVRDPMKSKQLDKGVRQLAEEGATQVFLPATRSEIIVGAVGALQFDLVAYRLKDEYRADCIYEDSNIFTVRWLTSDDRVRLREFEAANAERLARDGGRLPGLPRTVARQPAARSGALAGHTVRRDAGTRMNAPQSRSGVSLPLHAGSASGPATPTSHGTTAAGRCAPVIVCSMRGSLTA